MPSNSPSSPLGDLVRAFSELGVSDSATQERIAEMLGIRLVRTAATPAPDKAGKGGASESGGAGGVGDEAGKESGTSGEASSSHETEYDSLPINIGLVEGETTEGVVGVRPVAPQASGGDAPPAPPPFEPLLLPRWARAILSAALSTSGDDGPPDIERIAEMLAAGVGFERLPTLPNPTLRLGAQLLVDTGDGLLPFTTDQLWLQTEIEKVTGADRVATLYFAGSPLRGAGAGLKPWPPYEPPPPGTPVVLLTDLGIARPMFSSEWADEREWLEFARLARRAGCPVIAFVPFAPARWPARLTKSVTIIQLDRGTTAAKVRALVGTPGRDTHDV